MRFGSRAPSATLSEEQESCIFNGIDGATGNYMLAPLSLRQLAGIARSEPRYHLPKPRRSSQVAHDKGAGAGVNPLDLGQSGWGVVFAPSVPAAHREALSPLLVHRQRAAKRVRECRYREMTCQPGESKIGFLSRHGVAPGPAGPDRLPYYLLLVGDPEEISFELQYQLDVQYAVGRIHFESAGDYESYARTVVDAETGKVRRPPSATFFGPRHAGDYPTALSSEQLAAPLAASFAGELPNWSVRTVLAEQATRDNLSSLLQEEAPALLFTAGHGLCFRAGHDQQLSYQGSLICQDWPGPGQPLMRDHYFAADDVADSARIAGMIAFHFSCFGAGTPRRDAFPEPLHGQREIARCSFLSRLCRRLLAHPAGGAQAVVGHVDRAWSWTFASADTPPTLRPVFESTFWCLAHGYPIGLAMEFFNICYAELASDLDEAIRRSPRSRDERIAQLWTSRNDARNYAVLGDPAVRLAVAPQEKVP